jgi:hypothetical protein
MGAVNDGWCRPQVTVLLMTSQNTGSGRTHLQEVCLEAGGHAAADAGGCSADGVPDGARALGHV